MISVDVIINNKLYYRTSNYVSTIDDVLLILDEVMIYEPVYVESRKGRYASERIYTLEDAREVLFSSKRFPTNILFFETEKEEVKFRSSLDHALPKEAARNFINWLELLED